VYEVSKDVLIGALKSLNDTFLGKLILVGFLKTFLAAQVGIGYFL
jgi:hypothetical protein